MMLRRHVISISTLLMVLTCMTDMAEGNAAIASGYSSSSVQFQTLLLALQRNPALLQQLRGNPNLVKGLLLQQQQQKSSPASSIPLTDTCSDLRKQNARLKQMISAVLDGRDVDRLLFNEGGLKSSGLFPLANQARSQRELSQSAAKNLLNQAVIAKPPQPEVSLRSLLVTPTPTWTEVVATTSYETAVTREVTTELPIIVRGNKVYTTIVEPTVLTGEKLRRIIWLGIFHTVYGKFSEHN